MSRQKLPAETMTLPELADRLGISQSKCYEMAKADELPVPVMKIGGTMRVSVRAYETFISLYDFKGEASHAETDRYSMAAQ